MPRVGFEPITSAGERPKTYALDRAATGTGNPVIVSFNYNNFKFIRISHRTIIKRLAE